MCKVNVYYDYNGLLLLRLIQGTSQGINVSTIINELSNNDKLSNVVGIESDKVYTAFPCVISIKRNILDAWADKCVEQTKEYEALKDTLEKMKCSGWLVRSYTDFLDKEISRLRKLKETLKKYLYAYNTHLKGQFSFLNNSSIWIRIVDWNDDKVKSAKEELEKFIEIGLYKYGSAREVLAYNISIQSKNFLDSNSKGHGVYVTPELYGDESDHWKVLFDDNKIEKNVVS